MKEYGVELKTLADAKDADCIIFAVAHNEFREMGLSKVKELFRDVSDDQRVLIDVKGLYKVDELKTSGVRWWRL